MINAVLLDWSRGEKIMGVIFKIGYLVFIIKHFHFLILLFARPSHHK
jgi:hypothetical protein